MNKVFYVYAHYRKDNGELFYIGIGSDIKGKYKRANDLRTYKRNFIWANVYRKCGKKIKVEILNVFDEQEDAFKKEIELISKYGCLIDKKGGILANISKGGEMNCAPRKKVIQYDLNGKPIKIWENTSLAAKHYKVGFKSIHNAITKFGCSSKYQWRWFDDNTRSLNYIEPFKYKKVKKIHQYDLNGYYIKTFDNTVLASKETNIDRASINHCALGNRISCGGFMWSYTNKVSVPKKRLIIKYDFDMNKLSEYNSLEQIRKELGVTSTTAIRNCFIGKQKQAYGFIWKEIK